MRADYGYPQNKGCGAFNDGLDNGLFDVDYIALLAIVSVVLDVYALQEGDKQQRDIIYLTRAVDKVLENQEKLEGKLKRMERLLERSVYNEHR